MIYNSYSFEQQDLFVAHVLSHKKNGIFLDVACAHPTIGSNTLLLEKELGWHGYGYDIGDCEKDFDFSNKRPNTKFIQMDATGKEFTESLINHGLQKVDYISLDVDIGGAVEKNLSHLALYRILEANIKFDVMTIEHEAFKYGDIKKNIVRQKLESIGYYLLFGDISFPDGRAFEDWWISPNAFDQQILSLQSHNMKYEQAINLIRSVNP